MERLYSVPFTDYQINIVILTFPATKLCFDISLLLNVDSIPESNPNFCFQDFKGPTVHWGSQKAVWFPHFKPLGTHLWSFIKYLAFL